MERLKEITGLTDSVLQKKIRQQASQWEKQLHERYCYYRHRNGKS